MIIPLRCYGFKVGRFLINRAGHCDSEGWLLAPFLRRHRKQPLAELGASGEKCRFAALRILSLSPLRNSVVNLFNFSRCQLNGEMIANTLPSGLTKSDCKLWVR
jgi:hypothetical protein